MKLMKIFCVQSSLLHSQPKSTVGTPAYIAPEVLLKKEYNGKVLFKMQFDKPYEQLPLHQRGMASHSVKVKRVKNTSIKLCHG